MARELTPEEAFAGVNPASVATRAVGRPADSEPTPEEFFASVSNKQVREVEETKAERKAREKAEKEAAEAAAKEAEEAARKAAEEAAKDKDPKE